MAASGERGAFMGPAISTVQPLLARPWERAKHWLSVPPPRKRELSCKTRAIRGEDDTAR